MNYIVAFILVGVFVVIVGIGWVRLAPLPQDRFSSRPGPDDFGTHVLRGGVKYVLPLINLPDGALNQLTRIALAAPRTRLTHQEEDLFAVVSRTRRIGFPDITVAWVTEDALHVHAYLVYGVSDLGVNAQRVGGWLEALNTLDDSDDLN